MCIAGRRSVRKAGPASKVKKKVDSDDDDVNGVDEDRSFRRHRPGPASTKNKHKDASDEDSINHDEEKPVSNGVSAKNYRPGPASSKKRKLKDTSDEDNNEEENGEERSKSENGHETVKKVKKYRSGPASSKRGVKQDDSDDDDDTVTSNGGSQILFSTFGSFVTADNKDDGDNDNDEEDDVPPESWWTPDRESGRFTETGPNLRNVKFLKMKIMVEDKQLLVKHVARGNGNIKCNIKMKNVGRQMNIVDGSVIVEKRTPESHPFICPFAHPETHQPCSAAFKKTEQKYFNDHVIHGSCPFSQVTIILFPVV